MSLDLLCTPSKVLPQASEETAEGEAWGAGRGVGRAAEEVSCLGKTEEEVRTAA